MKIERRLSIHSEEWPLSCILRTISHHADGTSIGSLAETVWIAYVDEPMLLSGGQQISPCWGTLSASELAARAIPLPLGFPLAAVSSDAAFGRIVIQVDSQGRSMISLSPSVLASRMAKVINKK